eukprot:1648905-Prymnesium_polylepis.1
MICDAQSRCGSRRTAGDATVPPRSRGISRACSTCAALACEAATPAKPCTTCEAVTAWPWPWAWP